MIRQLEDNDIEGMKEFLKLCHEEMEYVNVGIGFDFDIVKQTISKDNYIGVVEDSKGSIRGLMLSLIINEPIGGNRIAIESIWHSHPYLSIFTRMKIMKKLLNETILTLRNKGIKYIHIDTSVKFPAITKLIEKQKNFKLTGLHFVGEL